MSMFESFSSIINNGSNSGRLKTPAYIYDLEILEDYDQIKEDLLILTFKSGRMQKGYLVLDTVLRGLRGRAQASAEDLFRVALYDPIIAREMAAAVTMGRVSTREANRLQARWFALAPTLSEQDQERR